MKCCISTRTGGPILLFLVNVILVTGFQVTSPSPSQYLTTSKSIRRASNDPSADDFQSKTPRWKYIGVVATVAVGIAFSPLQSYADGM
jgi:hypothetical protein